MKDSRFLELVNPKMSKTHKETKFLRTKKDFIDDLLETESIYNIQTSIKDFFQVEEQARLDYYTLNRFVSALEGLDNQIFLAKARQELTMNEEEVNQKQILKLKEIKIDLLKDFANWLFL